MGLDELNTSNASVLDVPRQRDVHSNRKEQGGQQGGRGRPSKAGSEGWVRSKGAGMGLPGRSSRRRWVVRLSQGTQCKVVGAFCSLGSAGSSKLTFSEL